MKRYKQLFLILILLQTSMAQAIVYYKSKEGIITKIDEAAFKACTSVIFRESGKDELPEGFRRKLLAAILNGKLISNPQSASDAMKKDPGSCSYSALDDLK